MDYDALPVAIAAPTEQDAGRIEIPVFIPKGPRCPPGRSGEIVVCAEDPETFRLRPLPDKFEKRVPRTQFKIGETTSIGAEVESAGVGGFVSDRVMIRGKIKF
jgi:hypothetical protein